MRKIGDIAVFAIIMLLLLAIGFALGREVYTVESSEPLQSSYANGSAFVTDYAQPAHYADVSYDTTLKFDYGLSMAPTIFAGNTLMVKEYRSQELKEGQILCYQKKGMESMACHRILTIYPDRLIVKGDNNRYAESINRSDILAMVVGVKYT